MSGFATVLRDITARGRADEQFRQLLEAAPDAVVIFDGNGLISRVNARLEALFGYTRDELVGKPLELLVPERLRATSALDRERYLEHPDTRPMGAEGELRARRKNGSEFLVAISRSPLLGRDEVLIWTAIRDVSERVQADRRRAWMAAIVDASVDAIIGLTPTGEIQSWNSGAEVLYGYSAEEVLGRQLAILVPPDLATERESTLAREVAGEIAEQCETEDGRKDGTRLTVSVTASPIRDRAGTLIGVSRIARDISERARHERELRFYADHDPLTNLWNRRRFSEELAAQVRTASRYAGSTGAVLIGDLDNFKYVNDALGHKAGDQLIKGIARVLCGRLRETDVLARLGGDEFAAILPRADLDEAVLVAESLCEAVRGFETIVATRTVRSTISIGVAPLTGEHTPDEYLTAADLAMYDAKHRGRDCVAVTETNPDEDRVAKHFGWDERLRDALVSGRLLLYAQPIADVATGEVDRQELLLRMLDENGEIVLPTTFLYTAERFGLIREIDRWVVHEAIRLIGAEPGATTGYHVNLSGVSIGDANMLAVIEDDLAEAGIDPTRLTFEITETAAITDIDAAQQFMRGLHHLGCTSALDDFGSGFGSFSYLKYLPVDYLKIDGDFVRGLPGSDNDSALVKAIVDVGHALGKRAIAEHVTSPQAMSLLRTYGVDHAQGFALGEPRPLTAPDRTENSD